jgi:hypothetical protein
MCVKYFQWDSALYFHSSVSNVNFVLWRGSRNISCMPGCRFNVLNVQLQKYIYYWSLEIFKSTFYVQKIKIWLLFPVKKYIAVREMIVFCDQAQASDQFLATNKLATNKAICHFLYARMSIQCVECAITEIYLLLVARNL